MGKLVARGLFWNTLYQIVTGILQFGAMMVLVRLIEPSEYGKAGTVLGLLILINSFSSANFMAQAVQLREGEDPDWTLHWRNGLWIQLGLFLIGNAVASVCWALPTFREIAPLLHLGSVGLLIDTPARLRLTMLRRDLNFRRLRLVGGIAFLFSTATAIVLGALGAGAYALVVSGNVVLGVPFAVDLLLVGRWRPTGSWLNQPEWSEYTAAWKFGLQQSLSSVLRGTRGLSMSVALPPTIGFTGVGLINRAEALFGSTSLRVGNVISDTVYPALPQVAYDKRRFADYATTYLKAIFLVLLPGAAFIAVSGRDLSRLVYGRQWVAADPLLLAGALIGLGSGITAVAYKVLLAQTRLRRCIAVDMVGALLNLPLIAVAFIYRDPSIYCWAAAAMVALPAMVSLYLASQYLHKMWWRHAVLPPLMASTLACLTLVALAPHLQDAGHPLRLAVSAVIFGITVVAAGRFAFRDSLGESLDRLPGARLLKRLLLISGEGPDQSVAAEIISPEAEVPKANSSSEAD